MAQGFFDFKIDREMLSLYGDLKIGQIDLFTSSLHRMIEKSGYKDITIDMRNITLISYNAMPPIASICRYYSQEYNVDFEVIVPSSQQMRSRLRSSGLHYYIDTEQGRKPDPSSSDPKIISFRDHEDQISATDTVLNNILRTTSLDRQHIKALEWAVNEITDNVLTHSKSKVGGFLITYRIPSLNIIEFVVADCGIGVSQSLGMTDDVQALSMAIQEGVTSNKKTNQGNGLYGTYRLACASSGIFVLRSRRGNLFVNKDGETHERLMSTLHRGTFITCQIDYSQPDLIERAFIFNGKAHVPEFDYVEKKHEGTGSDIHVNAYDICKTFGSRKSGIEARNYIKNLLRSTEGSQINIDFSGTGVISSSFADEVFGKLFVEMGPMPYMRSIHLHGTTSTVEALISRAIQLRAQTGLDPS